MGVKIKSIAMFLVVLLPLVMIGMIAVMDNTNHSTPTPEEEDVLYLDYGFAVYAGQTFNQPPDLTERRHLAWLSDRKRK